MTTPDRAAKVAERILHIHATTNTLKELESRLASLIRREVKRAVEEEREACAQICDHWKKPHPDWPLIVECVNARDDIRARGKR